MTTTVVVNDGLSLVSYEDEAMAQRVAAYLAKELTYCKDAKVTVFRNPTPKAQRDVFGDPSKYHLPYWWCSEFIVGIPTGGAYWKTYTTSIQRAVDAAGDFVAGYRAASSPKT